MVITPTAGEEAPAASGSDPAGIDDCGIGADGSGTDTLGSGGGAVEAGSGSDIGSKVADTRLICCCSLPLTDRRLYVWTIGGRGLKADRRRGASDRERRKNEVAARVGLPAPFRKPETICFCLNRSNRLYNHISLLLSKNRNTFLIIIIVL